MNALEALKRLRDDPNEIIDSWNEWVEAGLWTATCSILEGVDEGQTEWTEQDVDALLGLANKK